MGLTNKHVRVDLAVLESIGGGTSPADAALFARVEV